MDFIKKYSRYIKSVSIIIFILLSMLIFFLGVRKNIGNNMSEDEEIDIISEEFNIENGFEDVDKSEENKTDKEEVDKKIYVHICGSVKNEGVYELENGSRIYELIEKAGGFSDDACKSSINLADELVDKQQIYVLSLDEKEENINLVSMSVGNDKGADKKININKADKDTLMSLPGIGSAKADDIIEYRDKNRVFKNIEEIKNIKGIKDNAFNKLKDRICVD